MSLQRKQRIFYLLFGITIVLVIFVIRLAWIQWHSGVASVTANGRSVNERAADQRKETMVLDTGRGQFVDRNGHPLTGKVVWTPVLFPVNKLPDEQVLSKLANVLNSSATELNKRWKDLKEPFIWTKDNGKTPLSLSPTEARAWNDLAITGTLALPFVHRYEEEATGRQWLGYISQRPDVIRQLYAKDTTSDHLPITLQVGASGLERTLDAYLRGEGATEAFYMLDGLKQPLPGLGPRISTSNNRYYPVQVQTTISLPLQREIERITTELNMKEGAVVVLDAVNADIISMVSRPLYEPNHIDIHGGEWSNRAVKAVPPGSIFKTVIAAAALDFKVATPKEKFVCNGPYGKYGLSCWKEKGHGHINFQQGFALSCNTVFASLGERLTDSQIEWSAHRLGLGRTIGWSDNNFREGGRLSQIDQEEAGAVFSPNVNRQDGGVKAQTAIGQRDVLVSPLQAANLVVTLLHGGTVLAPRLVSSIHYADGTQALHFSEKKASRSDEIGQISQNTAALLLSWMRTVVTEGTGQTLNKAIWQLAGKSGTAQVLQRGQLLNNQWFIGYGPVSEPRYAVAVLVQNRYPGSSNQATKVFRQVMDKLATFE